MIFKTMRFCKSLLLVLLGAACDGGEAAEPTAGGGIGTAVERWCTGYYVTNVVARDGVVFFVSPEHLMQTTEGWGPQALSLNVDRGYSPQVSYEQSPSVSLDRNMVTKSLQASLGFSLAESINLDASTVVLVPTGAYYRIEAYPEYQVINWDLLVASCGPTFDRVLTTGTVYRPVGVYFRVMVHVGGEWNALRHASSSQLPGEGPPGADVGADGGER